MEQIGNQNLNLNYERQANLGDSNSDKKEVNTEENSVFYSTYDDNKNAVIEKEDNSASVFLNNGLNIQTQDVPEDVKSKMSNFDVKEQYKEKMNKLFQNFSYNTAQTQAESNKVVEEQLNKYIQTVNTSVQELYNETLNTAKTEVAKSNATKENDSVEDDKNATVVNEETTTNDDGSKTKIETLSNGKKVVTSYDKDGKEVSKNTYNSDNKMVSSTKIGEDGKEHSVTYDGKGNTTGVVVQNGESISAIAQKFGCSVEELEAANKDLIKTNKKGVKYFLVGEKITVPKEVAADDKSITERKSSEETTADWSKDEAVRNEQKAQIRAQEQAKINAKRKAIQAQRAAAERQELNSLGVQKRQGGKFTAKDGKIYNMVGKAAYNRVVVKDKSGKYHVFSNGGNGPELKTNYVKSDISNVKSGKKRVVINGKAYYTSGKSIDKRGRMQLTDWKGNTQVLSGGKSKTDLSDRKLLNKGYVQASNAFDAGQGSQTFVKNGVKYVKDSNGKVWYFNKQGQALVKGQYSAMVKQEADAVTKKMQNSVGVFSNDKNKSGALEGIEGIYSSDIMNQVDKNLSQYGAYKSTVKTNSNGSESGYRSIERFLITNSSRSNARVSMRALASQGAYGTTSQTNKAMARIAAEEIKYELHGGTGYTSTADLKDAIKMCTNRETRLQLENNLKSTTGSDLRSYIAEDGWSAEEVDRFDAVLIENNSYDQEHDQEHRNQVLGNLIFKYDSKESLHIGLKSADYTEGSADKAYLDNKAASLNKSNNYQAQFKGQYSMQTYLAGRSSDNNKVDVEQLSACNTLLYKGEKPARIQAEELLYSSKNGANADIFSVADADVLSEIDTMIKNGEVKNCKSLQDAYNQIKNNVQGNDKTRVTANAIISGKVEFKKEEITNFCIELMHSIDKNKGDGASTGRSASYTNVADEELTQLQAILQAHPEVIDSVKARVSTDKFESITTITSYAGNGPANVQTLTTDNKKQYLDIINNTNTISSEEVFFDANGNRITDEAQIKQLKQQNLEALSEMRKYVAELKREFQMGVDEEGWLSDAGNGVLTYSGLGTDRTDVANKYKEAKNLLAQLEAAANGKLRNSKGQVVSMQSLAKEIVSKEQELSQTNGDYKSSVGMAKMGIVLAPVIAVTTVATGGTAGAGWTALAAGGTTLVIEGTMYGTDLLTSETGNTAEAREATTKQVLTDSVTSMVGVKIGAGSGSFVNGSIKSFANGGASKMMNVVRSVGTKFNMTEQATQKMYAAVAHLQGLGIEVGSDALMSVAGSYVTDGEFNQEAFVNNMILSVAGNTAGHIVQARSDMKNVEKPNPSKKTGPTMDPPKYVVPENETILGKATRNGNDPSKIAPSRSVELGTDKFNDVKLEVQNRLANIDKLDNQDLALLEKQIDSIKNRGQRRELEAMVRAKKEQLSNNTPVIKPKSEVDPAIKPEPSVDPSVKPEQPIIKPEPSVDPIIKPEQIIEPQNAFNGRLHGSEFVEISPNAKLKVGENFVDLENLPANLKQKIDNLVDGQEIKIGRNDITPSDMTISSEHLIIKKENGILRIKDISTNGTTVMNSANFIAYNEIQSLKSMNHNFNTPEFTSLETKFLNASDNDFVLLNKLMKSNTFNVQSHRFKNIMGSTNSNNKIILEKFLDNPSSIKKGKFISEQVSAQDIEILMLFNRNNTDVESLISSRTNINNFLDNVDTQLNELRKSYGLFGTSNKEIADAIQYGRTRMANGYTVECNASINVLDDLENLVHGKDYIAHFGTNETPHTMFAKTQTGDVASINGTMYVNDGEKMVKLNVGEDTFREMFPPVKRFSTHQGAIGDCYLVTSINILANSKSGRAKLYQMVGEEYQNGKKVYYTKMANGNGKKEYFQRWTSKGNDMKDKNGLALIEQGYCMNSERHSLDHRNVTRIMLANEGGSGKALTGLTGAPIRSISDKKIMGQKLKELANRDDVFMFTGTITKNSQGHDHVLNGSYDIHQRHAYSVLGYNETTKTVKIANPWHSGVTIDVPFDIFMENYNCIQIAQI